jgi:hypothetical protein
MTSETAIDAPFAHFRNSVFGLLSAFVDADLDFRQRPCFCNTL